jgi:hypothetical protein
MENRMTRAPEQQPDGLNLTSLALLVGSLGGLGIVTYGESLLGDIQSTDDSHAPSLANWQVHMGAVCMGTAAFVIIFFLLELLGRQSKRSAWQSSWPWLPLVGLTALATIIHIPVYAVIPMSVLEAAWAYRRMQATTGTSKTKGK